METLKKELSFDKIAQLTSEELVSDRELQKEIYQILTDSTRDSFIAEKVGIQLNKTPVVDLKGILGETSIISEGNTFTLEDNPDHIYYIPSVWPVAQFPDFLDKQDIILSGKFHRVLDANGKLALQEVFFNKELGRVNIKDGSLPERYNSKKNTWEVHSAPNIIDGEIVIDKDHVFEYKCNLDVIPYWNLISSSADDDYSDILDKERLSETSNTSVFWNPDCLGHQTGNHPENHMRLVETMRAIYDESDLDISIEKSNPASVDQIESVHSSDYIEKVRTQSKTCTPLDIDTVLSKESYNAALSSAGTVIDAIDYVNEKGDNAFAITRPPGHHAAPDKGMGYCLFNNVAIGARYAQELGYEKILIIDLDVHHGNGTQAAFYEDPSVSYFSLHQSPTYPGTGSSEEIGIGAGEGYTHNIPLPAGSGDKEYLEILGKNLMSVTAEFDPDMIIVSAGYDAHIDDNLSEMNVTVKGYQKMTEKIKYLADKYTDGKMVWALEGGYNKRALSTSVVETLKVMSEN